MIFVHEEDEDEHVLFGFSTDDLPLAPNPRRQIDFAKLIEKDQRPGVYVLDKITFETFGGKTLDHEGNIVKPKFEVVPEQERAPMVKEVSVFSKMFWEAKRRVEAR